MMVYKSRHTPGLEDGRDVSFDRGETVTYRFKNGNETKITIVSDILKHSQAPGDGLGYEARFHDNDEVSFASRYGIVAWDGKTD